MCWYLPPLFVHAILLRMLGFAPAGVCCITAGMVVFLVVSWLEDRI